jgi:predicted RNA methylase
MLGNIRTEGDPYERRANGQAALRLFAGAHEYRGRCKRERNRKPASGGGTARHSVAAIRMAIERSQRGKLLLLHPNMRAEEAKRLTPMRPPFERRFRSTVPFYAAYRVAYPDALIAFVAERCGLARGSPVLDLGCGPGQLAVAFARLGCTVAAMDPEPDMLAATAEHAAASGVAINLVEGSSYDLGTCRGPFQLVAMGRSFHWMDRDATLHLLDRMVDPSGAVVLFGDRHVATPGGDWPSLLRELGAELVPGAMARRPQSDPAWEPHETVLLRSPFGHITLHGMTVARRLSTDDIVGLAYSKSSTSPEALGEQREAFERRLRAGLAKLAPNALFDEIVEIRAVVARRHAGW